MHSYLVADPGADGDCEQRCVLPASHRPISGERCSRTAPWMALWIGERLHTPRLAT